MSLPLGVLQSVANTERKYELEAKTLHVGHLEINGLVRPVAFTVNELSRPLKRAESNKEDLPVLKPSEDPKIDRLEQENKEMRKELEGFRNRTFFQRLKAVFTG